MNTLKINNFTYGLRNVCLGICLLILLPFAVLSQTDVDVIKVKPGKNGQVYVCGNYYGIIKFTSGDSIGNYYGTPATMFLCKLDSSGNVLWYKNIKGVGIGMLDLGMAVDTSDNVLITSTFKDTLSVGNTSIAVNMYNDKMFLLKFGSAGNLLWTKIGGGSASYSNGNDVALDKDNNIYVTGRFGNGSMSFGCASVSSGSVAQVFVSKFNASGNCSWIEGIYGNPSNVRGIAVGKSGDVYVNGDAGPSFMFSPGLITVGASTYSYTYPGLGSYIAKFSNAGTPLLLIPQTYSGYHRTMEGLAVGRNEQVFCAGQMSQLSDFGNAQLSTSTSGTSDGFVVKYRSNGTDVWAKQASGGSISSSNFGSINGIAYDSLNHHIVLAGRQWPLMNFSPLGSFTFPNDKEQYFVKLDSTGAGICQYNLQDYSLVMDVSADAQGFIYTAGNNFGDNGVRVSKYTGNCAPKWSVFFKTYGYYPPVSVKEESISTVKLFPNPAMNMLTVESKGNSEIYIYNSSGKVVAKRNFVDQILIEVGYLPNGLYFAEISSNKGMRHRKLVIQHD
jgi:hypothetical protein